MKNDHNGTAFFYFFSCCEYGVDNAWKQVLERNGLGKEKRELLICGLTIRIVGLWMK